MRKATVQLHITREQLEAAIEEDAKYPTTEVHTVEEYVARQEFFAKKLGLDYSSLLEEDKEAMKKYVPSAQVEEIMRPLPIEELMSPHSSTAVRDEVLSRAHREQQADYEKRLVDAAAQRAVKEEYNKRMLRLAEEGAIHEEQYNRRQVLERLDCRWKQDRLNNMEKGLRTRYEQISQKAAEIALAKKREEERISLLLQQSKHRVQRENFELKEKLEREIALAEELNERNAIVYEYDVSSPS